VPSGSLLDSFVNWSGSIDVIHVVGGGCQSRLLNQFTTDASGIPLVAGPVEATALGNLLIQAVASGDLGSQADIREILRNSVSLETFMPADSESWEKALEKFSKW
jgi:rhamnulokinase